ncbi:MAG TPA: NAD(+) kinase [Gammaproteobacteria bacterium]|nr:NAD(+) kinase [Gammaproteobacteria bacterium]
MTQRLQTVGIVGKYGSPNLTRTVTSLVEYLEAGGLNILLDEGSASVLKGQRTRVVSREQLGQSCDLVVVVGGDGTFLDAARSLAASPVALLGVNLGRLGFMVDVSPESMAQVLDEVLSGNYQLDERFLLEAAVLRGEEPIQSGFALNDVVVTKRDVARMIDFDTHIDGRFISNHRADGLIVATPTGSTAYALSSGGPVMHPRLDAVALVPICPHTLSDRPIIVDSDSVVEVVLSPLNNNPAQATWDGQFSVALENGDRIRVQRTSFRLKLIHPPDYDYFTILRSKLHWGRNRHGEP